MFKTNKEHAIMYNIKKTIYTGSLFSTGTSLIRVASTAFHITPIQPSVVITLKRVINEYLILSKF